MIPVLATLCWFADLAPATDPPTHVLANDALKLTVVLPDAERGYYRGTRFEWSGIISKAEYRGQTMFGDWVIPHRPTNPESAPGTAEEFGMFDPPGYADAPVGGTFLKIGVGELVKPKEPKYSFMTRYKIAKPGGWVVTKTDRAVEFTQEVTTAGGWGYRYVKRLSIDPKNPVFTIERTLTNTGTKPLHTDHYGHHFYRVGDHVIGPDYRLKLPFEPKPRVAQMSDGEAKFVGGELVFGRKLTKGTIYTELGGLRGTPKDNAFELEHAPTGIGLMMRGDRALARYHVWAIGTALCPEPFVEIKLEPGAKASWSNRYEFYPLARTR